MNTMSPEERSRLYDLKLRSKMGGVLTNEELKFVYYCFTHHPRQFGEVDAQVLGESIRRMNPSAER